MTMIAASIKAYEHEQRLWIYEDAGAQFSETLLFMALHDEFGFGQKRMERIVKYWNELPETEMNLREWIQCIAKYGYDNKEMDRRYAVKVLPLASSGLMRRNKINGREYKDRIHNVILGAVVITYHILIQHFRFDADQLQRLSRRLYGYAYALRDEALKITIYDFMTIMKKECGIGYDILTEYEKQNGKIKVGPKWGINMITGKARKRDANI